MKAFVCLAISCLLIGLLYVYVRQQFAVQTNQITQLTGLIKTMAAELTPKAIEPKEKEIERVLDDRIEVSDDSESESDDSDSESDEEEPRVIRLDPPRVEAPRVEAPRAESPRSVEVLPLEISEFAMDLPETLEEAVIDVSSKKIVIETNYESWSLKDLKAKISELGGPSLKTKKLMVEYLEKKV